MIKSSLKRLYDLDCQYYTRCEEIKTKFSYLSMNPATAAKGTWETHRPKFDHMKFKISMSISFCGSLLLLVHRHARITKAAAKNPNIPAIYMQIGNI